MATCDEYMDVQMKSRITDDAFDTKKAPLLKQRGFEINAWRCPTLTWGGPTLPSAQNGFTSEFEMGSGGSHSLWSPSKPVSFQWV